MMIATMDWIEVIDLSEQLGKYIARSEIAEKYKQSKIRLTNDKTAQRLITRFVKMKEQYEEVQRFGKYHPEFKEITTKTRELKRALDLNDAVADFKHSENELENLLNEVSTIIAGSVSAAIKVPTGNPFFDSRGCQGGCGSGGPCGCRS